MAVNSFQYNILIFICVYCVRVCVSMYPFERHLNFTQLAGLAGLPCEEEQITTEDGYILDMFHIPGDKRRPVLIQSGNLGTSDDYIILGNTSLPYILWKAGYDTWMGNVRGCRYGRRHVFWDPDRDAQFWDFSFHEFAVYDTPAMIDYILKRTRAPSLSSIAWSFGTTVNYILGAERPEYRNKVNVIISFAPIAFLHHSIPFARLEQFVSEQDLVKDLLGQNEVFAENSEETNLIRRTCSIPVVAFELCMETIGFPVFGDDGEQMEPDIAARFLQHFPSSTSIKNAVHQHQILVFHHFAQFDYGPEENKKRYGTKRPKRYDLRKNDMNVVLISGKNDLCSALGDVAMLKAMLPNVVQHIWLKPRKFNHIDFVVGKDTHKVLYEPIVLDILEKYINKK